MGGFPIRASEVLIGKQMARWVVKKSTKQNKTQ